MISCTAPILKAMKSDDTTAQNSKPVFHRLH